MNKISEMKWELLMDCFADNMSVREAAKKVGVAKETAHRVQKFMTEALNWAWAYDDGAVKRIYRKGRKHAEAFRDKPTDKGASPEGTQDAD